MVLGSLVRAPKERAKTTHLASKNWGKVGKFPEDETLMTRNMFVFGEVYAVLENGSWYGPWKSRIFLQLVLMADCWSLWELERNLYHPPPLQMLCSRGAPAFYAHPPSKIRSLNNVAFLRNAGQYSLVFP